MNPAPSNPPPLPGPAPVLRELTHLERQPVTGLGGVVDALLRQPRRLLFNLGEPANGSLTLAMLAIMAACALAYGFIAGTFSGGAQLWLAPLKVAGGLLFASVLCLPSLYVFACLSGARASLADIAGLLAGLLALSMLLLFSFAPVAWVFSQSTESLAAMGGLHLLFALIALCFGVRFLLAGFRQWEARALGGAVAWVIIFVLVTLQLTTALRPIIGRAETVLPTEKRFFLAHWGDCLDGKYDHATSRK